MQAVNRIYVRAPNWVGDFVMATAAFERLRRAFPAARITCALRPYLRDLCGGATWFDDLIDAPKGVSLASLAGQARTLRGGGYDLAVILPNSFATSLVPFLARIPRRVGYRQGRPLPLTDGPRAPRGRPFWRRHGPRRVPEPMPGYYAKLLDGLGLPPGPDRPRLHLRAEDRAEVDGFLRARAIDPSRPLLLLTAGASYGASKLWEPERFAAVARHFAGRGFSSIVLAGPAEVELAKRIAAMAGESAQAAVDPLLSLGGLKALCARAGLMVTSDTGPRHVALAFDVPIVCLMGPTDSRYTDYALEGQTVIQRKDLACVPCQRKVCPLGHHECMKGIPVDRVIAAAEELLLRRPAPGR